MERHQTRRRFEKGCRVCRVDRRDDLDDITIAEPANLIIPAKKLIFPAAVSRHLNQRRHHGWRSVMIANMCRRYWNSNIDVPPRPSSPPHPVPPKTQARDARVGLTLGSTSHGSLSLSPRPLLGSDDLPGIPTARRHPSPEFSPLRCDVSPSDGLPGAFRSCTGRTPVSYSDMASQAFCPNLKAGRRQSRAGLSRSGPRIDLNQLR